MTLVGSSDFEGTLSILGQHVATGRREIDVLVVKSPDCEITICGACRKLPSSYTVDV